MDKSYTCVVTSADRLDALASGVVKDAILFSAFDGANDTEIGAYVSRDDAVDLAWSILEHYDVAQRPAPEWKVNDYMVVRRASSIYCGLLGRVVEVRDTAGHVLLAITDLAGERHWVGADDATRLTPAEFRTLVNTRVSEIMTEF